MNRPRVADPADPFKPTWDGVYPHLRDVPADGSSYDDERYEEMISM